MKLLLTGAAAVALLAFMTPANAALINAKGTGINYTLTEADTADPLTDRFTLSITGINAATDTEGGRSGVNAIAFSKPTGLTTAVMVTPPSGYTYVVGGLNSSGCDGSGNFFCFDNTAIPPTPGTPFAANSSLTFVFDVTTATGNFAGYNPSFKIDWVGSKNNYDLISLPIGIGGGTPNPQCSPEPCTDVPEPASIAALGTGIVGMTAGLLWYRRRQDEI